MLHLADIPNWFLVFTASGICNGLGGKNFNLASPNRSTGTTLKKATYHVDFHGITPKYSKPLSNPRKQIPDYLQPLSLFIPKHSFNPAI
jgi:hypothetical protein